MSDKPILFSAPMVRALLAGSKTQTRRVLTPQPPDSAHYVGIHFASGEPESHYFNRLNGDFKVRQRFHEGDRLYVREAWRTELRNDHIKPSLLRQSLPIYFEAGGGGEEGIPACAGRLRPGMHMPRWASRLTLTVTEVRVQQLQEISEADAAAEGWPHGATGGKGVSLPEAYPIGWYSHLWDSLNADRGFGWSTNPWVVATSFTVAIANIDESPTP